MAKSKRNPRLYFGGVFDNLSEEAQKCDVGIYVKECQGAFVNNFTEGRIITITERLAWLRGKMTARRTGRFEPVTLAGLFPADWEYLQTLR